MLTVEPDLLVDDWYNLSEEMSEKIGLMKRLQLLNMFL